MSDHHLTKAIIIDLDGTLANNDHRLQHVENKPKDFDKFYQGIPDDKVNQWCSSIIELFQGNYKIILLTGREQNDYVKNETLKWLDKNQIIYDEIFFREINDYRQDYIIKEEIYKKEIEPKYDVLFCVDDRSQVVDMWRRLGLTCLQCGEGEF